MAIPTPLVAADIILDSPLGKVRPEVYLDQDRLKSIALQYEQVYIVARSNKDVQIALDEGRLKPDDVIEADRVSSYDLDTVVASYAQFFDVAPEQVARFFKPLPVESNRLVSRPLFRGVQYGAQSQLPGFAEIDLWTTSMQMTIVRRKGQAAFDRRPTENAMRDRVVAAWLWINDGIPTITANSLLFDIMKELTELNLTLNRDLLKDEGPLWETINIWVDRYLQSGQSQISKVPYDPIRTFVPNCASLSWRDLFRLRDSSGFQDYIGLSEGLQIVTSEAERAECIARVHAQMFELAAKALAKPGSVLCEGLGEEVAGWLLPGFGLVNTALEAADAWKRRKNYAAICWLMDARKTAAAA